MQETGYQILPLEVRNKSCDLICHKENDKRLVIIHYRPWLLAS